MKQNQTFFNGKYSSPTSHIFYQKIFKYFTGLVKSNFLAL